MFACSPALNDICHTPMARCSLFVLKVLLNNNKPYQTILSYSSFTTVCLSLDNDKLLLISAKMQTFSAKVTARTSVRV